MCRSLSLHEALFTQCLERDTAVTAQRTPQITPSFFLIHFRTLILPNHLLTLFPSLLDRSWTKRTCMRPGNGGGGGIPSPIPWRPEEEGLVIGGRTRQGHIRLAEEPLIRTKTERRPLARTGSREEEKRTNLSLSDKLSINEQKGIKRKFRNARRPLEANKQTKKKENTADAWIHIHSNTYHQNSNQTCIHAQTNRSLFHLNKVSLQISRFI